MGLNFPWNICFLIGSLIVLVVPISQYAFVLGYIDPQAHGIEKLQNILSNLGLNLTRYQILDAVTLICPGLLSMFTVLVGAIILRPQRKYDSRQEDLMYRFDFYAAGSQVIGKIDAHLINFGELLKASDYKPLPVLGLSPEYVIDSGSLVLQIPIDSNDGLAATKEWCKQVKDFMSLTPPSVWRGWVMIVMYIFALIGIPVLWYCLVHFV